MDRTRDYHTKWSKSHRERQVSWYHSYWNPILKSNKDYVKFKNKIKFKIFKKKSNINELIYKK